MREDNCGLPASLAALVWSVIGTAEGFLGRGEELEPVAFVGKADGMTAQPMALDMSSEESKERSADAVRRAARALGADFALLLAESWMPREEDPGKLRRLMEIYGSVSAMPRKLRKEVALVSLETREGVWIALPELLPCPPSKKKRKLGAIEFMKTEASSGRFMHLLPEGEGAGPARH